MRVLHAADFGGSAPGGFVPLLVALARRLRARGDAFALAVPRVADATWHPLVREAGAELHVVSGGAEAARFARAWRPDVAHVHFFGWELPVTLALWPSRARVFWHAHSTSLRDGRVRRGPRSVAKYRGAGMRVERFVAVSRAIGAEIAALGAPARRIVTIPNAVDARRFRPPSFAERAEAREALGIGGERAVLFFGRDPELKGAGVLAGALRDVRDAAVIAVATPEPAREALAAHARVVAIERADDVVPLLWAADALAMPSRGEGAPFVLLEALRTGLPAAATDLPALREAGGDAVRYAPVDDARAFAEALDAALAAPRGVPPANDGDPLDAWAQQMLALY